MFPPRNYDFDLSDIPDEDELVAPAVANPYTDMDLSDIPDETPVQETQLQVQPEQQIQLTPEEDPSVLSGAGIWDTARAPLSQMGRRNAPKINEALFGDSEHPHARFGRGVVDFAGNALDTMTAPINAIPMALGGLGSLAVKGGMGALGGLLNAGSRIASAPAVYSGTETMRNAESMPEFFMGAAETVGNAMNMRRPKLGGVASEVAEELPPVHGGAAVQNARINPQTGETIIPGVTNPLPKATKVDLPDYSPTTEKKARKIYEDLGVQLSQDMSNIQIIDGARALTAPQLGEEIVKKAADVIPDASKAAKVKVKSIGKNEFIHPDFPDLVVDADGNIRRTISGNPISGIAPEVKRNLAVEVLNTPRAINASMDMSFPLRQGITLMHKPGWWKAWNDMRKSFGSDKAFQGVMDSIRDKPNYKTNIKYATKNPVSGKMEPQSFADWSGLAISDMANKRELEHMTSLAERIPGYKQIVDSSNRGYTAFANKLRSDTFDSLVDDFAKAGMDPRKDRKLAQEIAGFVNNASGRGSIKGLEKHMDALNTVYFSPRLQISRAKMAGTSARAIFDPKVYDMSTPNVRREYLQSMLTLGGAWVTAATAAQQMGAEVSLDPTNSDFGKIKIGNSRIDPGGGFQQFIVLAARMAQQKSTRAGTEKNNNQPKTRNFADASGPYDPTMGSVAGDFNYSKLAPLPRAAWDLATANKNEPFDIPDQVARMISPIMMQDLMEIYMNEGNPTEYAATLPQFFGVGGQTFGGKGEDFQRRMLGPNFGRNVTLPARKKTTY